MQNNIKERTFSFAVKIVQYVRTMPKGQIGYVLGTQLLRSGTSIGANVEEALGAKSRKEFINSMNIAKREARETRYWLKLLQEAAVGTSSICEELLREAEVITRILTAIVKTSQRNSSGRLILTTHNP